VNNENCDISLVTVNYNGLEDTCALIDTIASSDYSLEVIVVDNGSKVNEAEVIKQKYPETVCIRSEKNLGFAGGNNLGLKVARGRWIYFINNDTIFEPFNPKALIERLESSEKIGMVCPKICFAYPPRHIQFAGFTPLSKITVRNKGIGFDEQDKGQYNAPHPTPYAHGAAMMVKRSVIEKVGAMPECYFLYYEEYDWSESFRRAGYEIWYEPKSVIYHKESRSTGQNSPLKTYYLTRNRLLFVRRNYPHSVRPLTYTYLLFVVATRDILKNMLHRRFDLAKATLRAINDFIKN